MGYGPRRHRVDNPDHPTTIMHEVGQGAKADVRKLSNAELDNFIRTNMGTMKDLEDVLKHPRHKKIRLIKDCAMLGFAQEYEQAKAEAAAKEAKETEDDE